MGDIHICSPPITETRLRMLACPTCKKRRKMWCWSQEWYGWHVTCLTCGEAWQDGEMLERPFMPRWREKAVADARKMMNRYPPKPAEESK